MLTDDDLGRLRLGRQAARGRHVATVERSLVIIKPDAVQRGLIGAIVERYERRGLKIVAMRMHVVDRGMAERHYGETSLRRRSLSRRRSRAGRRARNSSSASSAAVLASPNTWRPVGVACSE